LSSVSSPRFQETHPPYVSSLSGWAVTLSTRLFIPVAFRLVAFAFYGIPYPLGFYSWITPSLLTTPRGVARLHWGYFVPHARDTASLGSLYTPGACGVLIFRLACNEIHYPILPFKPFPTVLYHDASARVHLR